MTVGEPPVPRVSVVMPVYNVADSVDDAVESIRRQTFTDWEMVAVEDGSTDSTFDRLRAAASREPRIRVLRNDRNLGLAASLNRGWRHARGELIARMDGDDASVSTRLATQVAFLDAHPEVAVLGGLAEFVDQAGHSMGLGKRPQTHDELASKMYKEAPFVHPTVMMRRGFLLDLDGYDEHLRRGEDVDLWLRGYRRYGFHNLQVALVRYSVPQPSWETVVWNAYALARSARREGLLLTHGWYSLRFVAAALLTKAGLHETRLD